MDKEQQTILEQDSDQITKLETDLSTGDYDVKLKKLAESLREALGGFPEFNFPKVTIPDIGSVIPKINIPTFNFNLPKIKIPDFDEKNVNSSLLRASRFGWTLTECIEEEVFLKSYDLEKDMDSYNRYFLKIYEKDKSKLYKKEKEFILDNIGDTNKILLKQCFMNYESNNFHIIIPCLIAILEGEISRLLNTQNYGGRLLNQWHREVNQKQYNKITLVEYTLAKFMKDSLFLTIKFEEERNNTVNRNWVLHGRDDPNLWSKSDALKLIINLSSLLSVKNEYKKEMVNV